MSFFNTYSSLSYPSLLYSISFQGVNRIAEGARTVASKAKKLAGRILDVAEDVGSMTAIAKRAIVDLVEEIQGPTGTTLYSKEGEKNQNQTVTSDSRVKS